MNRGVWFVAGPAATVAACCVTLAGRWPGVPWVVVVRDGDRHAVAAAAAAAGVQVTGWCSDKPTAGKVRFVRDLRRQRYDLGVVSTSGDPSYDPVALGGWLCGARHLWRCDLNGELRPVGRGAVLRLAAANKVWRGLAEGTYRSTVGRILAAPLLALRSLISGRR